MRLAVLSGTFNPVHKAHIALAVYVQEKFMYDKILVIPAYKPPFKDNNVPAQHRYNMVELAIKGVGFLEISDIEFQSEEKSYSVNTLKKLYKLHPIEGKIGFIAGTDTYVNLDKWYHSDELKELAEFIVFERGISFEDNRVKEIERAGFKMIKAFLPFKDISSTEIRTLVSNGLEFSKLVTPKVEEYIKEYGLYK